MNEGNRPSGLSVIKFLTGSLAGSVFPLNQPAITIGCDPTNDIVIKDDQTIVSFHARILWKNGFWSIEKHPQANTITINAHTIQHETALATGATVGLGENTTFLFLLDEVGKDSPQQSSDEKVHTHTTTSTPSSTEPAYASSLPPPSMRRFTGPILRPDATLIAPLSALGIPSLEVSSNNYSEKQTFALDKQVVNIGRDATNDIVINDQTVSGHHVQVVRQGNTLILVHPHPNRKQTLNGLFYQGRKIRGDEPFRQVLTHGDIFRISNENGSFVSLTYNDGSGVEQVALPPVKPIKLRDSEVKIGRAPDNTVVLAHPQVSAHHARLISEGGTHRILDLGSTNHVYINGQLITNTLLKLGDEIRIGPYRLLYEGTQLTEYNESNSIRVDALNLKKFGNNRVTLLNNISLSIPPRTFVALVGGSGAGKSTLLNALSGLNPAQEGKVLYNGQDYYRNLAAFNTQIGYVPQDDIVHRDLTVGRALFYAARMRLPRDFTREQISQRIDEVLDDVEMKDRRNLLISKLSGGQRKRVSIALELLANPSLFFLDEPTSGLDPGLDRKMMFLLRKLADKGHTIILVTHATNNLSACDFVCFLTRGGRLAYFGPPEQAKLFFAKDDFAEIYSCLEPTQDNAQIPEEAEVKFRASKAYQQYVAQPLKDSVAHEEGVSGTGKGKEKLRRARRGNPFTQFRLLCVRQLERLKNNRSNLMALIIQAPLVALLLMLLVRFEIGTNIFDANTLVQCKASVPSASSASGLLVLPGIRNPAALVNCSQVVNFLNHDPSGKQYANSKGGTNTALQDFIVPSQGGGDAQRVVFLVAFFIIIFGLINGSNGIVKEAAIYQRERSVNLSLLAYMFSKIFVLGLIVLLQSAIMLVVVQVFEPLSQGVFLPVLLETYITLGLVGLTGVMFGILLSSVGSNEDTVSSLLPLVIIPQVILSGAIIPLKDWLIQIVATVVPSRWALVAIGSTLGLHSDKIDGSKLFGDDPAFHGTLYSIYSSTDATQRILLAWGALATIIVVLTLLTGISLKGKDRRK